MRPTLSFLRIGVGLAAPAIMWSIDAATLWPLIIAAVIVGEVIDRCEFYMELDVPTLPAVSDRDLEARLVRVGT